LTEVDLALGITFPATNQGAGTLSQYFVVYSIEGSTGFTSVMSASGTSSWNTGVSTVGASASLTQFQGGWSVAQIHPMTFASTSLTPGEYVVGHLLNFSQASSTWTVGLYGAVESLAQSTSITAFTASPTAASVLSSNGLTAVSAFTGTTNITVDSLALSAASALTGTTNITLSSMAIHSASGITGALGVNSYNSSFIAPQMLGGSSWTGVTISGPASAAASTISGALSVSVSNTQAAKAAFSLQFNSSNSNIVSGVTLGVSAGSIITGTTAATALSASGYLAGSLITGSTAATALSASGYQAGSILSASTAAGVISNAGTAQINPLYPTIPGFVYIGTGSSTGTNAALQNYFLGGIMSTGAIPASIALSTTALTYTGTAVNVQPWMAVVGT